MTSQLASASWITYFTRSLTLFNPSLLQYLFEAILLHHCSGLTSHNTDDHLMIFCGNKTTLVCDGVAAYWSVR